MAKLHPHQIAGLQPEAIADLKTAHGVLEENVRSALELRNKVMFASTDTNFALGEATGLLAKAKALLGRDIDDALAHARSTSTEAAPPES